MTIDFNLGSSLYDHNSSTTIIILPFWATIFLFLSQLFPLVSTMESSYGKKHNYNSHTNLSTFDVMYDNKSQIFEKSYKEWTTEWWRRAYSVPIDEDPTYNDY